jgi:arylsulfatase A-like enzyme
MGFGILPLRAFRFVGQAAESMDLFPTFATLAGVPPPVNHPIDGMDMMPIVKREDAGARRELHWRFGEQWAARRGDWKLVNGGALYHLGNDPGESKNLSAEHPEVVEELLLLNRAWTRDVSNR